MRCVIGLLVVTLASVASSYAQEKKGEPAKAEEKDLTGVWDGGADGKQDWGDVWLKKIRDEYVGTYTATFNDKLGNMSFKRVGERKYEGLWWESDLKRHGTCELEVSKDGGTVTMTWRALDDRPGADKGGKNTWKKKAGERSR